MFGAVLAQIALWGHLAIVAQMVPMEVLQAVETESATTQPSTQPVVIQVQTEESTGIDVFGNTKLGKLFRGEERLTPEQSLQWQFWLGLVTDVIKAALAFLPRLFVAIIFLLVFWLLYRGVRRIVVGSMGKANVDPSIRDMLAHLLKWAIMGFGLVIACNQIGIQIAALLTGVSIIGLAIGFAAQETLANFIAGVVIFWDKPFKIGDWLEIDGELAQVARVTFRSTRLNNLDNDVVIIPNTLVLSQKFLNKSTNDVTRATVSIGIGYGQSIDKAREVLLKTVEGDSRVMRDPRPIVEVRECGASSVDLKFHFWIRDEEYEDALGWEYLEKAKKALDAEGIEIPFPHVQLLVEKTAAIDALAGRNSLADASN